MERELNPQKSAKLRCEGEVCGADLLLFDVELFDKIILYFDSFKHFYIS